MCVQSIPEGVKFAFPGALNAKSKEGDKETLITVQYNSTAGTQEFIILVGDETIHKIELESSNRFIAFNPSIGYACRFLHVCGELWTEFKDCYVSPHPENQMLEDEVVVRVAREGKHDKIVRLKLI